MPVLARQSGVMICGIASAARPTCYLNRLWRTGRAILILVSIGCLWAQSPPVSPGGPWHSSEEQRIVTEARRFGSPLVRIDPERVYSLAGLVDLAEANNPETRITWEGAVAQAGALGVARSELFPVLVAAAMAGADRSEANLGARFYRETVPSFQIALELNYTLFDFGARRGRINAESARLLALDFSFNDVHRQLIYSVSDAYYHLLNEEGQEEAAGASLVNAQAVQQAAEERLRNGLATLPDVLEARSATAQAQYDLQAVLDAEQIARGALASVLGVHATTRIRVQSLNEVPAPEATPHDARSSSLQKCG